MTILFLVLKSHMNNKMLSGNKYLIFEDVLEKVPHFFNQMEIDDLISNMNLTKSNTELFISRMK